MSPAVDVDQNVDQMLALWQPAFTCYSDYTCYSIVFKKHFQSPRLHIHDGIIYINLNSKFCDLNPMTDLL